MHVDRPVRAKYCTGSENWHSMSNRVRADCISEYSCMLIELRAVCISEYSYMLIELRAVCISEYSCMLIE